MDSTLTITNVIAADAASYQVVVSNVLGAKTSLVAALTVVPAPTISYIATAGTNISLNWDSVPGQQYRLESKSNVNEATWLPATAITNASGTNVLESLPRSAERQFYRVVLLP